MAEMLCAIPARAGSKRLIGKNLLPLAGKPMIAYTITVAMQSRLFKDIYVCTEDQAIADVAKQYGAKVPVLMPPELCGDLVASHVPCQYLADYLAEHGLVFQGLVCLQPTSPLRNVADLRAGVQRFAQGDVDFVVSVTPVDPHYFHWVVAPAEDGYWKMYFGKQFVVERPLLPSVYRPNGSVKIADLELLRITGNFFGSRLGVIETPEERSIHIATRFDFEQCEFLLSRPS